MTITKRSWKSYSGYTLWEHYTCFHQQDNLDDSISAGKARNLKYCLRILLTF